MAPVIATARVSTKGQITIPVCLRRNMGLRAGSFVTFIRENDGTISLLGATLAALRQAQESFAGAAQERGIRRHQDLNRLIRRVQVLGSLDSTTLAPPAPPTHRPCIAYTVRVMVDASVLLAAILLPSRDSQETFRICSRSPYALVIAQSTIREALSVAHTIWPQHSSALRSFFERADYEYIPSPRRLPRTRALQLPQRPNAVQTYMAALTSRVSILLSYTRDFSGLHPPHLTIMSPRVFARRYGSVSSGDDEPDGTPAST